MKIIGRDTEPKTPEEAYRRSEVLERELNQLNPYPRPRGFVFKAKTWEEFEAWKKRQANPRSW